MPGSLSGRGSGHGVVAAGHALTARAAEEVLREGGNAFDAALAAVCTACAAEPVLASLGGGGFLLAAPAGEPARLYDFFVHTPASRRPADELDFRPILVDFGSTTQEFHIGHGTSAVPGLVRGLFAVHRDLATMPMRDVVAPAVAHAADGVEVTGFQAYLLDIVRATFSATDACLAIYGTRGEGGGLVRAGERLRNPELADTLESLAAEGPDLFYRGEIGARLAADQRAGGQITRADLAAYDAALRAPLALDYRGVRVETNPPPSSGGLLAGFGLALAAPADVAALEHGGPEHVELLAAVMEATAEARLDARAGGAHLDADAMLAAPFVELYRERVAGRARCLRGTTHMSVIDAAGNLASLTVSNGEGSGYVIPGTGVVLNNMLGEEDLNPGGFHRWPPAHRMTSMMAPTAIRWPDGRRVATGSGGSNRIRTTVLQIISNLVDFGLEVEEAVLAPRVHFERGRLDVEGPVDPGRLEGVLDRFPDHHLWTDRNLFFGGAHTVERDARGGLRGAGDPRRAGVCVVG